MSDPTSKSVSGNTVDAQTPDRSKTTSPSLHATRTSDVDTKDAETAAVSGSLDTSGSPQTASPPTQSDPTAPTALTQDASQSLAPSNATNASDTPTGSPLARSNTFGSPTSIQRKNSLNVPLGVRMPVRAPASHAVRRSLNRRDSQSSSNANN